MWMHKGLRSGTLKLAFVTLILGLGLSWSPEAAADIYRYVDDRGVVHFTNVKTDARYHLYFRSSRKSGAEYIRDYGGIILQASKEFGISASLIKAIIKAESDFDHKAVSHKGAQGLMQLMPQTATDMEVGNPFDPSENIYGGTRYLKGLLERFKNDKRLAIAAYNAGPQRVEACKGIPPFPETEAFVKRVMDYYQDYSRANR